MARPFSAGRTSWFPRSGSILTGQLCHATANNARHALRPPASRTVCGQVFRPRERALKMTFRPDRAPASGKPIGNLRACRMRLEPTWVTRIKGLY